MKLKINIIILIILCNFFVIVPLISAKGISIPYCKASQLKIYEIADYFPGMSQSQTLYGVINISRNRCRLSTGKPSACLITKKGQHILVGNSKRLTMSNARYLIVDPLSQKDSVENKKLVWFALEGVAACDFLPMIDKVTIKLPGISNAIFNVGYQGYSGYSPKFPDCGPALAAGLQKSIYKWEVIKGDNCSCSYFDDNSHTYLPFAGFKTYEVNHPPYSYYCKKEGPTRIYFKKIAKCG